MSLIIDVAPNKETESRSSSTAQKGGIFKKTLNASRPSEHPSLRGMLKDNIHSLKPRPYCTYVQ